VYIDKKADHVRIKMISFSSVQALP